MEMTSIFFQRGVLLRGMVLLEGWRGARCKEYRSVETSKLVLNYRVDPSVANRDALLCEGQWRIQF